MAENTTGDPLPGAGGTASENKAAEQAPAPAQETNTRTNTQTNPRRTGPPNPSPVPPGTSTAPNPFAAVKFIVEVDDGNGSRLMLNARPRHGKLIRGRFDFTKFSARIENEAMKPLAQAVIPGILISVTGAKRQIVFVDPLGLKDNEGLKKTLQTAIKEFVGSEQSPEKTIDLNPLQNDDMKSWLYWIRRALDAKQIVVRRGEVPTMGEVEAFPGRIRHQVHDRDPKVEFAKSDFPYMAPGASVEAERLSADYEKEMNELFAGTGR